MIVHAIESSEIYLYSQRQFKTPTPTLPNFKKAHENAQLFSQNQDWQIILRFSDELHNQEER
jgi:hypothetical protein